MTARLFARSIVFLGICGALGACAPRTENATGPSDGGATEGGAAGEGDPWSKLRAGSADTLDVGSWNVEWFGSPSAGPADDALQASRFVQTLSAADVDLWQLSEVVGEARFKESVLTLSDYAAVLANEPRVENGSLFYSANEQKVALVYRRSRLRLLEARVVLTDFDADFAGRPPVEARFSVVSPTGATTPLTVLALHMKAGQDADDWAKRSRAAAGLKRHLDSRATSERILVLGDWNDDVSRSLVEGEPSPYEPIVADSARYVFTTMPLSEAAVPTMPYLALPVDHHLASRPMADTNVPGSARVLAVEDLGIDFENTVSDHRPVVTSYAF